MPRTLAGQVVALQLVIVALVVVAAGVFATVDAQDDADSLARQKVTAVAVALADAPSTAAAITGPDPSRALQPIAEEIWTTTGIGFITVMGVDGTRFTHPRPEYIGQTYLGSREQALRGEIFTETYTGYLGPSIRTIAPVRDRSGRIVGLVAAGITQSSLSDQWRAQVPQIVLLGLAALAVASIGLWLIRRRLLRQTGGLSPKELRVMYDHHDAVLHAVREGLIVVDAGRPVLLNDEARRLLGADDDLDDLADVLFRSEESLRDTQFAHGGRVLLLNRSAVPGRRDSWVVTVRDRTEVADAMGELDSMRTFAEALRSKAHESANRLHTVVTLIEMGRPDEAARLATDGMDISQRLTDRVNDAIDEPALAALLLGKSFHANERGIALTLTEDSDLGDGSTDVLSVREMITVVGNLVDNALDACDPDDPWVEVTLVGDDDHLTIMVADSGTGMTPEQFEVAQQRGYSTKLGGDQAGRGLGLALVAQIVERHRGIIATENTYGSVITVKISASSRVRSEVTTP